MHLTTWFAIAVSVLVGAASCNGASGPSSTPNPGSPIPPTVGSDASTQGMDAAADAGAAAQFADGATAGGAVADGGSPVVADAGCAIPGCVLTTLASGRSSCGIAVGGSNVYWVTVSSAMTVLTAGGTVQSLIAGQPLSKAIALDATNIYLTTSSLAGDGGVVMKVARSGGTPDVLATGQTGAGSLAVDATSVYWVTHDVITGAVMKAPLAGGTPATLASGQAVPVGIAVDATSVYWVNAGSCVTGGACTGSVMKAPLDGGTPTTLASGQDQPSAIAVDARYVYWTNAGTTYLENADPGSVGTMFGTGTVMRVPLGGGSPTAIASALDAPGALAIDDTSVYFAAGNDRVSKVALGGGAPVDIATGQLSPCGIAVDSQSVFWTNEFGPCNPQGTPCDPTVGATVMKATPK